MRREKYNKAIALLTYFISFLKGIKVSTLALRATRTRIGGAKFIALPTWTAKRPPHALSSLRVGTSTCNSLHNSSWLFFYRNTTKTKSSV
jgi:hypothetical protein